MADIFEKFEQKVATSGVTETAFPVADGEVKQPDAIYVQTPDTNTDPIFIGKTGVKADYTTGAIFLSPSADVILPFNRDEILYHISSAAGQKLFITYLAGKL